MNNNRQSGFKIMTRLIKLITANKVNGAIKL